MRRGKFSANFENAEFLAVSVVSIVSFLNKTGLKGLSSDIPGTLRGARPQV